jgi:hypothetical protein
MKVPLVKGLHRRTAAQVASVAAVSVVAVAAAAVFQPLAAGAAPAASHQTRNVVGSAGSSGLVLRLFGTTITGGFSDSAINADGSAASEASALLTPGLTSQARAAAGQVVSTGNRCATPALPGELASLLSINIACSSSSASSKDGYTEASSNAEVANISINLVKMLTSFKLPAIPGLPALPGAGSGSGAGLPSIPGLPSLNSVPVVGSLLGGVAGATTGKSAAKGSAAKGGGSSNPLSPLTSALESIFGPLPKLPGGISLSALINMITNSKASQLLDIQLGPASSSVVSHDGAGVAMSNASGAVISLLPGAGLDGAPLLKIVVGQASVKSVVGGALGHSYSVDNPALVSIQLSSILGTKVINLAPGQSDTLLAGTPLASTIAAGYGATATAPDGTESSKAAGVSLDLLEGAANGIDLNLATPTASVSPAASAPTKGGHPTTPPVTPVTVPGATTPHTGLAWAGATPYLVGTGLLGLMLFAAPRLRRLARIVR